MVVKCSPVQIRQEDVCDH